MARVCVIDGVKTESYFFATENTYSELTCETEDLDLFSAGIVV